MSTPVRPKPYSLRTDRSYRTSVIRGPTGERRKRVASPIRYSPISRVAPSELANAPKAKRTRQTRLSLERFNAYTDISPRPEGVAHPSPHLRENMPIPRLQFDNEDFMDMYADEHSNDTPTRHRPDSVAFLSQCLSDALRSVITEPPLKCPYISPRLSTLRPRSHLRTPEYCYSRKKTVANIPKMLVADKEN
ncbi:hypothetical protein B9Z55_001596 [Caenorhabditis nigoni]|uniref:Uncharacterized protein n=1 Tax=Caenorhabditis nigoni TaxID=1611254 RepID=A0A2G5VGE4_9PELO|nr:hypothetical protein B9Z55_001596 [Caenorhabditis nigoni]